MTTQSELKVKIFADGADIKGIRALRQNPVIKGFTTNPTLMKQSTWTYNHKIVSKIVAPIDFIFFAKDPQFVIDSLTDNHVLPRRSVVEHLNPHNTYKQVNWGDLKEGFKVLKYVTMNDYKFIDHMSSNALVDPQFETWDDPKTWQFLKEIAEK